MPTNQDFIDNKYKYARVLNGDFEGKICKKSMTHFGDKKTSIWVDDSVLWMNNSDLQTVFYIGDDEQGKPKFLEVDGYVVGVGDKVEWGKLVLVVVDFIKYDGKYHLILEKDCDSNWSTFREVDEVTLHQPLYQPKEEEKVMVKVFEISGMKTIGLDLKYYKKSEYDAAIKNVKEVE